MHVAELIALTGATGYIGGRLLHALEVRGERVRCLSRRPEYLSTRVRPRTEVVHGNVSRPETLRAALKGVETAYYLVHSMGSSGSFAKTDREAATAFGHAARAADVQRIIYLGGLGAARALRAPRLRQEVGHILRESGVPTIEFRSSIVIGSGSASFEMLRALVERLPLMVTPRWVKTRTNRSLSRTLSRIYWRPSTRAKRRRDLRNRRRRRLLLPRPDARVRRATRPEATDGAGPGVDATALEPLASSRHAGVCGSRT